MLLMVGLNLGTKPCRELFGIYKMESESSLSKPPLELLRIGTHSMFVEGLSMAGPSQKLHPR
jgi:hypothetical protein